MKLHWAAWVLAAAVAGCSSIDKDTGFRGERGTAYALVAADGMMINGSQSYDFIFQRINIEKAVFEKDSFRVAFDGMGPIGGNEFRKPDGLNTTVRFGGKPTVPGDYAFITRNDYSSYGMVNNTQVNCFALGAVVYRLREGDINVVAAGNVRGRALVDAGMLKSQATTLLGAYHNMAAPVAAAEPIGSITFGTGKSFLGGETCNPTGPLKFTPRPNSAGVQARAGTGLLDTQSVSGSAAY